MTMFLAACVALYISEACVSLPGQKVSVGLPLALRKHGPIKNLINYGIGVNNPSLRYT